MKNLIVHKPFESEIALSVLEEAYGNNSVSFSAFFYTKENNQIQVKTLENALTWYSVKEVIKDLLGKDVFAIFWFGGIYPIKDACQPFQKIVDEKPYFYYWHSGEWKTVATSHLDNEEKMVFENFLGPVSIESQFEIVKYLNDADNGEFLTYSNLQGHIGPQRWGNWLEVDGVWFSNDSYKKKVVVYAPYTPAYYAPTKQMGPKESGGTGSAEIEWDGVTFAELGEGMRKYFDLPGNIYVYVARINNSGYEKRDFKVLDFMCTLQGSAVTMDSLKKLKSKGRKKFHFNTKVWRIDSLQWSRGDQTVQKLDIEFHNRKEGDTENEPNEILVVVEGDAATEELLKPLTPAQRHFLVKNLSRKYTENPSKFDESKWNRQAWEVELSNSKDEELKERAALVGLDYYNITS